jgi:signal transduction histidine kinase
MRRAVDKRPAPSAPAAAAPEDPRRAFLRTVSHELRTPLNSILGFSEILASELYGPLGAPQYKEYAQIVRDSGDRLLRMVNQLVELARLQAEAMDFSAEAEPLGAAVEEVLAGLAAEIAESAVTVKVAAGLPVVNADPRGLRAVLAGLIHNAVVFSPAGAEVRIAAARKGRAVEIVIENPGDPIDAAELARLRAPFEQGRVVPAGRSPGAGLGLSICTLTAEAMGGRLDLAGGAAGGLVARLRLPAG